MSLSRWADAWAQLLDDGSGRAMRRLAQGTNLLRSGRVNDVRLATGSVSGRVQGKRATPLAVEVTVPPLAEAQWRCVVAVLARQVRHRARLLAGQVPDGFVSELAAEDVSLLPQRGDLGTVCGCDDEVAVCSHVAAVWLAAAELIDADPFALLRVRGRGRERLLAEVAAWRTAASGEVREPGVAVSELDAVGWSTARADLTDLDVGPAAPPRTVAGPLRLLGDPPGWPSGIGAAEQLAPLVARAAGWAAAVTGGDADDPDAFAVDEV